MIRHYLSLLVHDENPRLHRIPFLLFWVASYGLIWVPIFVFINQVSCWLSGDGTVYYTSVVIDIFVGFVIVLTLFFIQSWLLNRRYGYLPKYYGIGTVIGGFVSGFGYPKLAEGIMHPLMTVDDMIIWFGAITLFQSVAMLYTNRRSWLIAVVGIGAASVIIMNLHFNLPYSRAAFVLATAIQSIGTGLAMLHLMKNPRQDVVPKRKSSEKPKHPNEKLSPFTFIVLWMLIIYVAYSGVILVAEMLDTFIHVPSFLPLWRNRDLILPPILGIILGISQHWLIGNYLGHTIRFWRWLTFLGWVFVGILSIVTDNRNVLFLAWLVIPIVAQMIAIRHAMSISWLWIFAGVFSVLVSSIFLETHRFYFDYPRTWFYPITIMSFATALAFVSIVSLNTKTTTDTATLQSA